MVNFTILKDIVVCGKRKSKMMNVVLKTCVFISLVIVISAIDENRKVFIAYMGSLPEGKYSASLHHYEILEKVTNPKFARKSLLMSYKKSFNGFAAYLSQEEQQKLAGIDGVISVFPSKKLKLHTTRSWNFMGFPLTVERSPMTESNTIVGVVDSGIWPESESFSDEGLGPIPEKWKGGCHGGTNFTCNREPKVTILRSVVIYDPAAPLVASFSSRGPSLLLSDIIKPDVTAPGVEILAAFSPVASPSEMPNDKRSVKYNILSGTSMATPHVAAAAAAYVKSFHPTWSPSAIKSALMTTAWEINPNGNTVADAEFAYGSGHIDPRMAKDPGLVYETSKDDYLKIWCNISQTVGSLRTENASCPAKLTFTVSFPRTVTNVGKANSKYVAHILGSSNLQIIVDPANLQFTTLNEKKSFVVTVRGKGILTPETSESGSLLWSDGVYNVRSPIVVYTRTATSSEGAPRITKIFVILYVSIITAYCICI